MILFFPYGGGKKVYKKTTKAHRHLGGNNTVIDVTECMRQGFCSGDYPSTVPSNLQEYVVTEFSGNADNNYIADLHKTSELNTNLSVGDRNYSPASPPAKAVFLPK